MNALWQHLGRIGDLVVVLGPLVWWLTRWARKIEMSVGFTRDVARIHLPYIYRRQREHDIALKMPVYEHPNIDYVNGAPAEAKRP